MNEEQGVREKTFEEKTKEEIFEELCNEKEIRQHIEKENYSLKYEIERCGMEIKTLIDTMKILFQKTL